VTLPALIAEFWYLLKARLALLAGRPPRARSALKSALRRNPNSFVAHFLLGRLYWRDQAVVKAKREFDLAWQIDPERFERVYARLRAQQEGVPELFTYPGEEGVRVSARRRVRRYGDFVNEAERRRFRSLPPITRDEILHIDWDRFQDEMQR
jgi:tetratricopeptide (TPR) repeat protein